MHLQGFICLRYTTRVRVSILSRELLSLVVHSREKNIDIPKCNDPIAAVHLGITPWLVLTCYIANAIAQ